MKETLRKKDLRLRAEEIGDGITRISVSTRLSRLQGFDVNCFLVGDILIDSGFFKVSSLLLEYLDSKPIRAIACTHNHEDHSGNCGLLARAHDCPVKKDEEGVGSLAPYRRIWWGWPADYQPEPMPAEIASNGRKLTAVPTPGHSQTHTAFFEEQTGSLFVGDLYVAGGVSAVMTYENPYESIESLRRVAELKPRRMLNGHGLVLDNPAEQMHCKADKIEAAARQVLEMHHQGASHRQIMNTIFQNGRARDWFTALLTGGEFSRKNFVKACIAHSRYGTCSDHL
jgi:glyoxylase-like metal-dependent hydrolase (beta-lactamase superfamily II)